MRKGWKYVLIILTGIVLLIAALLISTQTAFFKEKAKNKLIQIVENQLNLQLDIDNIEGNFFHTVSLNDVRFTENDSVVAYVQQLKLNYDLLPVTRNMIQIDSVIIKGPEINLWQNKDSSWNVTGYLKPRKDKKEKKQFKFGINADFVGIRDGIVSVFSVYKAIPDITKDLNLTANGSFQKKNLKVQLKALSFETKDPTLVLKKLSGIYNMSQDGIQLDSLQLITERSDVDLEGKYVSTENLQSNINAGRIDNNELALFIPKVELNCSPSLDVEFSTANNQLTAQAVLKYNNQSVAVEVLIKQLEDLLNKSGQVPYYADLNFVNFKVEDWINIKNNKALLFGEIILDGANLLNFKSPVKIMGDLKQSKYNEILFDSLRLDGNYTSDSLRAFLDVNTDFGDLEINGKLWDLSKIPQYKSKIETNKFDLTAYVPKMKGTKLSGTISAEGKGFKAKDLIAKGNVILRNSSVYDFPLDTLNSEVEFRNSMLHIDTLQLQVPGANARATGVLDLDSLSLKSSIYMDIDSLTVLDSMVVLPIAFDSAYAVSTITGPVRNLQIGGNVEIFNATGYTAKVGIIDAKYLVSVDKDSTLVEVQSKSRKIEYAGIEWDSLEVDLGILDKELDISANVQWKDTIDAKVKTRIKLGDTLSIAVPDLEINTFLSNYYLADTVITNILGKNSLEVRNFSLKDHNNPDFIVGANGILSADTTNSFELKISQLDLAPLNRFIQKQDSLKGILETEIFISGTAGNPEMVGTINIENPGYGAYGFTSLNSNLNYSNKKGSAEVTTPDLGDDFNISFSAPFDVSIDSLNFVFSEPDSFNASLVLDSLLVSESIKNLLPNDSINGIINANITARGDFKNPQFYGGLDLVNGHFESKKLGIDYDQIKTSINFDGRKITLDTVNVKQKGGLISLTGEMEFDSTIVKGSIISSSLQADANNFFVTRHRNYEILIDANTFVKTSSQNPEFGGQIKVIRSDVFLPALISSDGPDNEENVPMLVEALYTEGDSILLNKNLESEKTKKRIDPGELLNNLTGKLTVEIPRNSWIKSDNMRIELSGDIDIIKTGRYFELFGSIEILRGHYILYGKKLNIKEGEIIFQGGEELDPNLSFTTEYVYRGSDKEKRYLNLLITGNVSEPDITFILDGNEISETDGISVLVFGATSDEIGYSGQNNIISSIGFNAVANVITSQLSKTVGTQFNLDMIEVTATENWQSAAFVVGKYITNDLFVIYQRGFGEVDGDEITPETITLEYEINDKLMFRIQSGSSTTSGVDVILKFEQELKKNIPGIESKQ